MKKHTTPDKEIYSKEELELFEALENDLDNGTYQPMGKSELEEEKKIAQKMAKNTSIIHKVATKQIEV